MNYKDRKKARNVKKILLNIINLLKFDNINLNFSSKIIIIGNIILIISLFLPWVIKTDEKLMWNSFDSIGGYIGFVSILLVIFISFITIFLEKTQKIKLSLNISFKDYLLVILSGIFVILVGFIYINFINGLNIFFENIIIGKGVVFYLLSGIVILIGGFLKKKNYNNNSYETFVHETGKEKIVKNDKSNMQLPF